ncbi:exopolysaccharide biosynthesis protein [Oricola cellulosilytica]|uniref:Exopolysaccharide biosynthesis protein n=1 Tax=Oricola cellulosilytica TaxID=1429082 RepID=A0A4R0PC69_9HYPH|nr:exopolysaccharide biosynthesis protein [Oricola cellulosilytica]TCD15051.1 exopolysaccharide biosynthesis protein [Oricola cellulosilytica]
MLQQHADHFERAEEAIAYRNPRPLSAVLRGLAEGEHGTVSVGRVRAALADRSFATFLVFTASLNLLPIPPGTSAVVGIPIVLVAFQMIMGYPTIWLPRFFLRRSLSQKAFHKMTTRLIPFLERMETWVRPRYWPFRCVESGEKTVGLIALIYGIAVVIPIPFGNWLPALAVFICGVALSERDGFWLLVGIVTGIIAIAIMIGVVLVAGAAAQSWLGF